MPACPSGKVSDFQGGVFTESSRDRANPARGFTLGLPAGTFQKPLQSCAKTVFGRFGLASVSEKSRFPSDTPSDPQHDGHGWKQGSSKPGRIELNLDLFESHRRDGVAMSRASAIEHRGRAGDELLPDFGLV
jgi:hypothetical protein